MGNQAIVKAGETLPLIVPIHGVVAGGLILRSVHAANRRERLILRVYEAPRQPLWRKRRRT
jgi:hypothetical protein